jgi:hypothetical protein
MGVKFSATLDPQLRRSATAYLEGTADIQDIGNQIASRPDAYVNLLRRWLIGQRYIPVRNAVYHYALGCALSTPVKTGNARRNWYISNTERGGGYLDYRETPVSEAEASAIISEQLWSEAQATVGKAEGHSGVVRSKIIVENDTPYIGTLEAKHGMTANGIAEMLDAMNATEEA